MVKPYDTGLKKLVTTDPQAFIRWLFPGATFTQLHPQKLDAVELELDILIEIIINGARMLIHIEFQTRNDSSMAERLLWYNVLVRRQYKLPVLSFVIYLLRDGEVPPSPLVYTLPTNQEVLRFHFVNIEVSKLVPEDILNLNELNLLPLVPLTRGGTERKVVEQTITTLEQHSELPDLSLIAFTLASLAMRWEKNPDLDWLIRRFRKMHDLLKDSPIFQLIEQEGMEKGREEGLERGQLKALHTGIVNVIAAHYPELTRLAESQVTAIDDIERLQKLLVDVTMPYNAQEMRTLLLSLHNDKDNEKN